MISRAFSTLNRNLGLVLVPVLMDLASFALGMMTVGFWGQSKLSLKLALNVGLPSISAILEQNVLAGEITLGLDGAGPAAATFLLAILFLFLSAFVEAGFVGLLYEVAGEKAPSLDSFVSYGKRFWLRFLGLRLLVFAFSIIGILMAMLLSIIGLFAYMIIFIVLRVRYIYWEYTMLSEDLNVFDAFRRSRVLFDGRAPELSSIIIAILLANFLVALIINLAWTPVTLLLFIPIYGYVASALQMALMMNKLELNVESPLPVEE